MSWIGGRTTLKATKGVKLALKAFLLVIRKRCVKVWKRSNASLLHVCTCVYVNMHSSKCSMYVNNDSYCRWHLEKAQWGYHSSVFKLILSTHLLYTILRSLHSKKLHILGFLASMVWTKSLEIFFLSLSDRGTYHFCNRSFPCRLNNSMNCI